MNEVMAHPRPIWPDLYCIVTLELSQALGSGNWPTHSRPDMGPLGGGSVEMFSLTTEAECRKQWASLGGVICTILLPQPRGT